MRRATGIVLMSLAALAMLAFSTGGSLAEEKKYKIFLSMSYIGNDWQAEAANMLKAMAKHSSLRDRVDLRIQVAGPNAQKQIQQINSMVQAGADAIITFPISPTALNKVVKNACDKGVVVVAYDAEITEPCAYNISIDQTEAGEVTAKWLVEELGGKGKIVVVTGVPGTSVDKLRTAAAKAVFEQNSEIEVIAEANGMWSQAVAKTELSKILATHSWDDIDGLWMQVGCYTAADMQMEAGIADDAIKPCAGEAANDHRVQMLEAGTVEGNGAYRPFGYRSISYGSPPYSGALALKTAVKILDGEEVSKKIDLPLPIVRPEDSRLCEEGTWQELKEGCTAFDPNLVPPGWFADIYGPDTPEVGFSAALVGEPDE